MAETPGSPGDKGNADLDKIIKSAEWPAAERDRLHRLEQFWISQHHRPRRTLTWKLPAVAALVLIGIGLSVFWLLQVRDDSDRALEIAQPKQERIQPRQSVVTRQPTSFEQVVFRSNVNRRKAEQPTPVQQPARSIASELVGKLVTVADPVLFAQQVDEFNWDGAVEHDMARLARDSGRGHQRTALAILSQKGSYKVLPLLSDMMVHNQLRDSCLPGIVRLGSSVQLGQLIVRGETPAVQKMVFNELLRRGGRHDIEVFLNFMQRDTYVPEAGAAMASCVKPPVDSLLEYLNHPHMARRVAAARALGYSKDDAVIRLLARMLNYKDQRIFALMSLASASNVRSVQLVKHVERSRMRGQLNSARSMLNTF